MLSIVTSKEAVLAHLEANYDMLTADGLSRYVVDSKTGEIIACGMTHDKAREFVHTEGIDDLVEIIAAVEKSAEEIIHKVLQPILYKYQSSTSDVF